MSDINPELYFRDLFEQTGDLIHILNLDGQIITVNPSWLFHLGYSFAEVEKRSIYDFIKSNYLSIMNYGSLKVEAMLPAFGSLVIEIFFIISIIMLIISVSDYAYQRYKHNKDLKMSMQEIKEEYKQQEGDPQLKSKIRQKQREMASSRMMQQVPDATVVITNPTHLSIAIKYEQGGDGAPIVVAKGADNIAMKIREIAKENDIPIIENKPLARLIYKELDVGSEIPTDMYQAVAEILALVYKLKERSRG